MLLELHNVSKTFGQVCALHNISLQVDAGELVLLTGPSGAGKTTLFRTIYADESPDAGHVLVAGREVSRLRRSAIPYLRRNIGVVFQDFKLLDERSAMDNVALALEISGVGRRIAKRRAIEVLDSVGVADIARVAVRKLSGGERQRVAVARALAADPAIILADEPTGNLDPVHSHDVLDVLSAAASRNKAVLVATHDPTLVKHAPSTRVVRLERGRVITRSAGPVSPLTPVGSSAQDQPPSTKPAKRTAGAIS